MAKGDRTGLSRLEERLAKVARRSPFSAYLMANFDELTALIERYGPHWDEIAKWATEEGHTGGKPLSGDTARKAYERERDKRAKAGVKEPKRPRPAPGSAVKSGAVEIVRKAEPASEPDDEIEALLQEGRRGTVFEHMQKRKERK